MRLHDALFGTELLDQLVDGVFLFFLDSAGELHGPGVADVGRELVVGGGPGLRVRLGGLVVHLFVRGDLGLVPREGGVHVLSRDVLKALEHVVLDVVPTLVNDGAVVLAVDVVAGAAVAAHGFKGVAALVQGVDGGTHVVVIEAMAAKAVLQALLVVVAEVDDAVVGLHHLQRVFDGVAGGTAAVVSIQEVGVPGLDGLGFDVAGGGVQRARVVGRSLDADAVFKNADFRRVLGVGLSVLFPGGALGHGGLRQALGEGRRGQREHQDADQRDELHGLSHCVPLSEAYASSQRE